MGASWLDAALGAEPHLPWAVLRRTAAPADSPDLWLIDAIAADSRHIRAAAAHGNRQAPACRRCWSRGSPEVSAPLPDDNPAQTGKRSALANLAGADAAGEQYAACKGAHDFSTPWRSWSSHGDGRPKHAVWPRGDCRQRHPRHLAQSYRRCLSGSGKPRCRVRPGSRWRILAGRPAAATTLYQSVRRRALVHAACSGRYKSSQSPVATSAPFDNCTPRPRGDAAVRAPLDCAISRVASVEPPSTTMISSAPRTDAIVRCSSAAEFRVGMITDTFIRGAVSERAPGPMPAGPGR